MGKELCLLSGGLLVVACAEPPAVPADLLAARAFFDKVCATSDAYDPGHVDLYADSAAIRIATNTATGGVRYRELSGALYKEGLRRIIDSGERSPPPRYSHISVHREPKGFRIAAIRYSPLSCREDELFSMMVAQDARGVWQITERNSQSWEVSACPDAGGPETLAERLRKMAESVNVILPWPVGDHINLDLVTASEAHLAYRYTVSSSDPLATSAVQQRALERGSCNHLDVRALIADGGTLVHEFFDLGGRPLSWVAVTHCPEP